MATDGDVIGRLWLVVRGQLSLGEFEDWFLEDEDSEDTELQRQVTAVLAESAGNVDDGVAVAEIAWLLPPPVTVQATSSTATIVLSGFLDSDFARSSENVTEHPEPVPA